MQLRDIVQARHLRLGTLYSFDGCLDREVSWTYTTDLLDPTRYLTRNQLLLTGLVWRRKPADSETFIKNIAQLDPVALLAGEGLLGHVPDDVIAACERHGIPLFSVAPDISFASITAFISNTIASSRVDRLSTGLQRQRERLMDVYRGQMLEELIARSSTELGRPLWVISSTGRQIAQSGEPLEADALDGILNLALTSEVTPTTVTLSDQETYSVLAIRGTTDHRATSWFLVIPGRWDQWDPAILDSVHDLASVIGIYRVQRNAELVTDIEVADRLVDLVQTQHGHPEIPMYLKQCGITDQSAGFVVVAGFAGRPEYQSLVCTLLHDAVADYDRALVGTLGDDCAIAFIGPVEPTSSDQPADSLVTSLQRAASGFVSDGVLSLGISRPVTVEHIGGALHSAKYSLHSVTSAGAQQGPVQFQHSSGANTAIHLMSLVPDQQRRAFADGVLGKVIEQDARYGNDLIVTLRAYLNANCSWVQTSEALHVHVNTVRYRVRRVEELTGKDLSVTADRADLYLAISLL